VTAAAAPRVLVVDDEETNRSLLRAVLGREYEVAEAKDGPAGLEQLARREFDLVLLDVMMPGMTGYDVCKLIKQQTAGVFLPVVLLTALDSQDDRNQGLAAGADDFLSKPFDRKELELRCRALVRLRRHELLIREQINELAEMEALKDDLVHLMVHDLRNPLSGLMGSLGLIQEAVTGGNNPDLQEDVRTANESALRLRELLDDVLQVRLLEGRQVPLQHEEVRLSDVAAQAIETMSGDARMREVEVILHRGADPKIRVDRALVRRSVENLVANALKYSAPRGVVDLMVEPVQGGVQLDVADRGPGVPAAAKHVVFQKFGSAETKRGAGRRGYGLGLYLVNLAVAAHGGTASVHDRRDGGAVFRIVLPTVAVAAAA
jgi:signal transduction histidine kinase